MKRIVVATDGSEGGTRAVEYAPVPEEAAGGYELRADLFRHWSNERRAWLQEESRSVGADP